jgi:hypothetical protein
VRLTPHKHFGKNEEQLSVQWAEPPWGAEPSHFASLQKNTLAGAVVPEYEINCYKEDCLIFSLCHRKGKNKLEDWCLYL